MKNKKDTTFTLAEFSTINTQQYIDAAHKLRGEAIAEHIGVIKNVFKRKSSTNTFKK